MALWAIGSPHAKMPLRPRPSLPLRGARPLLVLLLRMTFHALATGAIQCSTSDLSNVHACETLDLTNASLSLEQLSKLADAKVVQELKVDGVVLGPSGAKALAEALKSMPKLSSLSVSSCSLRTAGAAILLAGLPPSLATLRLRHNILGDEAMRRLAAVLQSSEPLLQELDLSWNGITARGARTIADALQNNSALERLWLDWNGIKDRGARAFGEALPYINTLQALHLEHNAIKASGAMALSSGLRRNSALQLIVTLSPLVRGAALRQVSFSCLRMDAQFPACLSDCCVLPRERCHRMMPKFVVIALWKRRVEPVPRSQYISLAHNGVDGETLRAVEAALRAEPAADEKPPPKAAPLPSVTDESEDLEEISFDDEESDAGRDEL
eukprot:6203879-Pleurochrysis_carterae.AAC.3